MIAYRLLSYRMIADQPCMIADASGMISYGLISYHMIADQPGMIADRWGGYDSRRYDIIWCDSRQNWSDLSCDSIPFGLISYHLIAYQKCLLSYSELAERC